MKAPDRLLGGTIKCPKCGERVRVGGIASEPAPIAVGQPAHPETPLDAGSSKRRSGRGCIIAIAAALCLGILGCGGCGVGLFLILNWEEPPEPVTSVELSPAIQAKDIQVVNWERGHRLASGHVWVKVYLTSRQGYNPYTPEGNERDPDSSKVRFTMYDRNNVVLGWENATVGLPRIRAGEKVNMSLDSYWMPKAKRIVIHLKRE
jgi:hypothetical protein